MALLVGDAPLREIGLCENYPHEIGVCPEIVDNSYFYLIDQIDGGVAAGHIGPSPSTRFASPTLRCGASRDRAAPTRQVASMAVAAQSRPNGPVWSATTVVSRGLGRAEESRFASVCEQPA